MRRDGVTVEDVQDCPDHPDRTQPSVNDRTNYFRDDRETTLWVTAIEEGGELVIITVTRMRRK
jgi:hypothetical protein